MSLESTVKLAAIGNTKDIEEIWLGMLEQESSPEQWVDQAEVLKTLVSKGKLPEAEALATTAIDSLSGAFADEDTLTIANSFVLALKKSDALRKTLGSLYRQVYADTPGLEVLLAEAGVEGGRPPRRAIRTMTVCLQLKKGMFLVHRHEDAAARVENVDTSTWQVDINTGKHEETFDAVELADNYEPAPSDDFNVMSRFDPERAKEEMANNPAGVILNILRNNGPQVDSDELRDMLSPKFISDKNWSKWFSKARQELRLSPHVKISGRAPYYLTYDPTGTTFEEEVDAELANAYDSLKELALVEDYVRGCKTRKHDVSEKLLTKARDRIEDRIRRREEERPHIDLTPWLAAARIRQLLGDPKPLSQVIDALCRANDPVATILAIEQANLWPAACEALEESHPDNLKEALERLLPHAPIKVADHLAESLVKLGEGTEQFRTMADQILKEPVELNEGLLWLWNGPAVEQARVDIPLITIANRVLFALAEAQRRDDIPKDRVKQIVSNSRDALRARKHKRFAEMLNQIEPGVAAALRTHLTRLSNLARTGDDLLGMLRTKFPQPVTTQTVPDWLRDDALFVTQEGYKNKSAQLEELVNVKMRENAIAIGKAAELGDLSENSEYKFALEERDLLQARLAQMQSEMGKVKIIDPAAVTTDKVGIGSRITLAHVQDETQHQMVILGPWEADPDNGIFNYQSPLAQTILGSRPGDVSRLEFLRPEGEYRVVAIENALAT